MSVLTERGLGCLVGEKAGRVVIGYNGHTGLVRHSMNRITGIIILFLNKRNNIIYARYTLSHVRIG